MFEFRMFDFVTKIRVKNGSSKSARKRFKLNSSRFILNTNLYKVIIFTHRKALPLGYKMI